MGPLECEDCGASNTRLRSVREPHFGRFCLPCLAKRDAARSEVCPDCGYWSGGATCSSLCQDHALAACTKRPAEPECNGSERGVR